MIVYLHFSLPDMWPGKHPGARVPAVTAASPGAARSEDDEMAEPAPVRTFDTQVPMPPGKATPGRTHLSLLEPVDEPLGSTEDFLPSRQPFDPPQREEAARPLEPELPATNPLVGTDAPGHAMDVEGSDI